MVLARVNPPEPINMEEIVEGLANQPMFITIEDEGAG
jgi:hypothetical protein